MALVLSKKKLATVPSWRRARGRAEAPTRIETSSPELFLQRTNPRWFPSFKSRDPKIQREFNPVTVVPTECLTSTVVRTVPFHTTTEDDGWAESVGVNPHEWLYVPAEVWMTQNLDP